MNDEKSIIFQDVNQLIYSSFQKNLVYNYNFKYFSNKRSENEFGIPDAWIFSNGNEKNGINFDTKTNSVILEKKDNKDLLFFRQAIHEFPRWEELLINKIVTANVFLEIINEGEISFSIDDGIDKLSIIKSGIGIHELSLQFKVNQNAKKLILSLDTFSPLMKFSVKKVYANIGLIAIEELSCIIEGIIGSRHQYIATENPPAEELSLCNPSTELDENYSRLDSVLQGRFGYGRNNRSLLPDFRGYFSRAWNHNSDIDPDAENRQPLGKSTVSGDKVSTIEFDAFKKHDHGLNFSTDRLFNTGDKLNIATIDNSMKSKTMTESECAETRPKNIAELYTIKWA